METEGTYPKWKREERYTLKTYLTPISSSLMFPHLLRHWSFAFSTYELPNPRDKYVKGWRAPLPCQDPRLSHEVCLPHPSSRVLLSWFRGPQCHTYSSLFVSAKYLKSPLLPLVILQTKASLGSSPGKLYQAKLGGSYLEKIKPQCNCKEKLRVESASCIKWERWARI